MLQKISILYKYSNIELFTSKITCVKMYYSFHKNIK